MSVGARSRRWLGLPLIVLLGFAGCERQPSTAELEIAAELRAMRLAMAAQPQANQPQTGELQTFDRDQITTAMAPLRDVLAQLSTSQRDLAERQATLTQEMRRWTELMVGSMQEQRAEEGRELAKRLQQLEQSMATQDARHREVEGLMQGALDRTADRLEEFLQRVGAMRTGGAAAAQPENGQLPGDESAASGGADASSPRAPNPIIPDPTTPDSKAPDSKAPDPQAPDPKAPDPKAADPATGGGTSGGEGEQRAATDWLWVALALLAIGAGWWLLRQGRRPRPVAINPDMQARPEPQPTTIGEGQPDEPEVEELWAAAALLGEAIGRLKHSSVAQQLVARQPLPTESGQQQQPDGREFAADGDESLPEAADFDDLFVLDESDGTDSDPHDAQPGTQPTILPAVQPVLAPPVLAPPTPRSPAPAAIVWRLPALDPLVAEARVRGLLEADPRVLLTPPPEVHSGAGSLRVSFVLLPGVPAGERSLLEQRLRDVVA